MTVVNSSGMRVEHKERMASLFFLLVLSFLIMWSQPAITPPANSQDSIMNIVIFITTVYMRCGCIFINSLTVSYGSRVIRVGKVTGL